MHSHSIKRKVHAPHPACRSGAKSQLQLNEGNSTRKTWRKVRGSRALSSCGFSMGDTPMDGLFMVYFMAKPTING